MPPLLDAALQYAGRGWHVFPCKPRGKTPLVKTGYKAATTDSTQIHAWWSKWPDANIGIATGASGLVVLDVDGHEGRTELAALLASLAVALPRTLAAKTGREGGIHAYYRGAVPSSQVKGEHLDVRGTTGYVIAPPSIHENGNVYQWLDGIALVEDAPEWLGAWVSRRRGAGSLAPVKAAPASGTIPPRPAYLGPPRHLAESLLRTMTAVPYSAHESARIQSALAHIDPAIDGKTWFTIGAALHDLNWIVNESDQGFEIWDVWSSGSTGKGAGNGEYKGRANLAKRWLAFKKDTEGARAGLGTIFALAREGGWNGEITVVPIGSSEALSGEIKQANGNHALPAALLAQNNAIHFPDTDKSGNPRPSCMNARVAIDSLGIACTHDTFHGKLLVGGHAIEQWAGELADEAVHMLRVAIFQTFGFDPGKLNTGDAAAQQCLLRPFDPVADYLDALQWDGVPRLEQWLVTYMGAVDSELVRYIGALSLIAAVRRVRAPGCKFDQIIVFESPEGKGKSSAIEILAGVGNFSDSSILTLDDKAQQEAMQGIWLYEIADLAGMHRADVEKIKAFASRKVDRARPAYGRARVDRPRRCVFFATTNDESYLKSQTGNRRFWPVQLGAIDLVRLEKDRDQIWAEAASREKTWGNLALPESVWASATEEQEKRVESDVWEDFLRGVEGKRTDVVDVLGRSLPEMRISTRDLVEVSLKLTADRAHALTAKRLANVMRRLGWDGPKPLWEGGKVYKGYARPTK